MRENLMRVHYGYSDATGDYRITIDTELCNGCGECVEVCPKNLFELVEDDTDIDRDELVAKVRDDSVKEIGYLCPGHEKCPLQTGVDCHKRCPCGAINHSW
jgi:ferredoxin